VATLGKELARAVRGRVARRDQAQPMSIDAWIQFQNLWYAAGLGNQTLGSKEERPDGSFESHVNLAKRNGVVFACLVARQLLFAEARFQYQQLRSGRPGDYFGTPALAALEEPWPNGTTGDLLTRMILDVDLAGNFFARFVRQQFTRLRPSWVDIVIGSQQRPEALAGDLDAEVVGYMYWPGGRNSGREPTFMLPQEVVHWAPTPDPVAFWRGQSWLSPVIDDVLGDGAATTHKLRYFEQGATPNMTVVLPLEKGLDTPEGFNAWVDAFTLEHEGLENAYKTLFFGAGADVKVIGANLGQVDFKVTQGHSENRVCMAARMPAIIVGAQAGLDAATYSNFGEARRHCSDATMRPLWRDAAGSLAKVIPALPAARLWYDDRDIPFLANDIKDAAEILGVQATAITSLTQAGYDPDSSVEAVTSGDLSRLTHTGLFSVQLLGPGAPPAPSKNGASAQAGLPMPGSLEALERGCTCPVQANHYGREAPGRWERVAVGVEDLAGTAVTALPARGWQRVDDGSWIVHDECVVHRAVTERPAGVVLRDRAELVRRVQRSLGPGPPTSPVEHVDFPAVPTPRRRQ
jgi:hypothetical protein